VFERIKVETSNTGDMTRTDLLIDLLSVKARMLVAFHGVAAGFEPKPLDRLA
jgi:hypothetical protein